MSKTTYFWVGIVAALLLSALFTYTFLPREVEVTKVVNQTLTVEKVVEVPVNVTVVKEVNTLSNLRKDAVETVLDEIGDTDAFLTCGSNLYDESEVSISKFYDAWSYSNVDDDDGKYSVTYKARYKFDDNSDERACYDVRSYTVTTEDNENPTVTLN